MKRILFSATLLISLLLTACGSAQAAASNIDDYYHRVAQKENATSAHYLEFWNQVNAGYQTVIVKFPLWNTCIKDSANAGRDVVSGRYDKVGADGRSTGVVNPNAMFSLLAVNESYPDFGKCQQLLIDVANDTTAWKQGQRNKADVLAEDEADLNNLYSDRLVTAFGNALLDRVSTEFLKSPYAKQFGVPKVTVPTFNLHAVIYMTAAECSGWEDFYPGQARWNTPLGACELIAGAAKAKIFAPFLAGPVRNAQSTGVDDLVPQFQPAPPVAPKP